MKNSNTALLVLLTVLLLALTACGGGGGGGGVSPQAAEDSDSDGIPNANDAAPDDPNVFSAFGPSTTLSNPSNGNFSVAVAVNADGTIIGMADNIDDINKAARWSVDGAAAQVSAETLTSLDGNYSAAYAINDNGTTAGESSNGANVVPVVWTSGSVTAEAVPLLAGGGANGAAYGINTALQLVGESEDAAANLVAVFWSDRAAPPAPLQGLGGLTSAAYFLNDAAEAVGEAEDGSGIKHAVFWDVPNNAVTALPMLDPTDTAGVALSINIAGEIVGEVEMADGTRTAVLWRSDGSGGFTAVNLGVTSAAASNNNTRIVGYDTESAAIWDTRSNPADANDEIITGTLADSRAYAINDSEIVVGILGNAAFAIAPQ